MVQAKSENNIIRVNVQNTSTETRVSANATSPSNPVAATNNKAQMYEQMALGHANNAKKYADEAKESATEAENSAEQAQLSVDSILKNENFIRVNNNLSVINNVSNNITNVNYVGENIEHINQLVEDLNNLGDTTNIEIVANNIENINKAGENISSVIEVNDNLDAIDIVKDNLTDINYLAENIEDIQTVEENKNIVLSQVVVAVNNANTAREQANIATEQANISTSSANVSTQQASIAISKATTATEQATIATNKAKESSDYSNLSKQWAISTTKVDNTDYSSKYYADQAKTSSTTATQQATTATNKAKEAATSASNALKSEQNALSYANSASSNAAIATQQAQIAKDEVAKLSSVYEFKGSVSSFNNLPINAEKGDVYDTIDTGMNYAWTGTQWDALGGIFDVSWGSLKGNISDNTTLQTALNSKVEISNEETITGAKTFTQPLKIQNGQGTGSLIIGGDVNAGTVTNGTRKLARVSVPMQTDNTLFATLLGFDSSGDNTLNVANNAADTVSFGGQKKITNATSPMAISFCVTKDRGSKSATDKIIPLEMDANEVRFNVQPNYNGVNLATTVYITNALNGYAKLSDIPDISNLATKDEIPTDYATKTELKQGLDAKQPLGNYALSSDIPDISNLATKGELNNKQNTLTAGENITIKNNVISSTGGGASAAIGSIVAINCTADYIPKGHLPCNGAEYSKSQFNSFYTYFLETNRLNTCTYEEYYQDISTYGQCGKFAVDTDNLTFKVPTIKDGAVIQQALSDSELGKSYNEGLPNITATLGGIFGSAGALAKTSTRSNGSGDYDTQNADFNASRCSDVYGKTDETSLNKVQINAIALRYFVIVADGEVNQAMFDWSQWATQLDLINSRPHIVEVSDKSLMPSWYRIYSDGWCEQGGIVTAGASNTGAQVTLLKKLENNYSLRVYILGVQDSFNTTGTWVKSRAITNSSFYISSGYTGASSTAYTAYKCSWEAKGYIS